MLTFQKLYSCIRMYEQYVTRQIFVKADMEKDLESRDQLFKALDAVSQVIGHLSTVAKDARRLEKKNWMVCGARPPRAGESRLNAL